MPTLEFKGKPFVYSHHLSVPFRELVVDPKKSYPGGKKASLDDNLIVHGDNLEALKALLPRYAGKVDVIYIDPPYNTGNEDWAYNDAVNSPLMKQWLGKVVGRDDLERHDKWLCMMWPRLELLKELLSETGSMWVSCDDNEHHRLVTVLEEIFGEENYIGNFVWEKSDSPRMDAHYASARHDFVVAFAKAMDSVIFNKLTSDGELAAHYDKTDEEGLPYYLKPLRAMGGQGDSRSARPNLYFGIKAPNGKVVYPKRSDGNDGAWRWSQEKVKREASRIEWIEGRSGWAPYFRIYGDQSKGRPPETIWFHKDVGSNRTSKNELKSIFPNVDTFPTPKPVGLIRRILEIAGKPDSLVLDSFAGSGTSGHAVLAQNRIDDGDRRFILVETEAYADKMTAERIRRVIKGVKNAKSDELKKGLGGSFTYCELGEPIDLERFFDGKSAPSYEQVSRYVVYTATGTSVSNVPEEPRKDWFVAEAGGYRIHVIYRPDLAFMRGNEAALTSTLVTTIEKSAKGKPVLVYAAAKFVSQSELSKIGITFCQLPYAIYRVLGEAPDAS